MNFSTDASRNLVIGPGAIPAPITSSTNLMKKVASQKSSQAGQDVQLTDFSTESDHHQAVALLTSNNVSGHVSQEIQRLKQ